MSLENKKTFSLKLVHVSLKEAFVALTPYFIIASLITLLFQLVDQYLSPDNFANIENVAELLQSFYPLVLLIAVSYYLAENVKVDPFMVILLALSLLMTLAIRTFGNQENLFYLSQKLSLYALFIPIFCTFLLTKFTTKQPVEEYFAMSGNVFRLKQNFLTFLCLYILATSALILLDVFIVGFAPFVYQHSRSLSLTPESLGFIKEFVVRLLYLCGLHGSNTYDLFVDKAYLDKFLFNHLTTKSFNDLFLGMGGPNCLPLALAILFQKQGLRSQTTVKVALPFLLFNISEPLIFGLPLVFNRTLLLPFLLTPLLNYVIAYFVIAQGLVTFVSHQLPWTTPVLISGYLATGGHFSGVLLQSFLLVVGIIIYTPFVKTFLSAETDQSVQHSLKNTLALRNRIKAKETQQFQKAQSSLMNAHMATYKIIDMFTDNELCLYYQPKVAVANTPQQHFEALLRLRMKDGSITGPYFLETLEQAGYTPLIDLWVSQQLRKDYQRWQQLNFKPHISVNLHPDTLVDCKILNAIIENLQGLNVEFEILEKSIVDGKAAQKQIALLHQYDFTVAIDDFGTGYSSLDTLYNLTIDTIKLDKCLIDNVLNSRGNLLYLHAAGICKELGLTIVSEGIENEQQYLVALESGVHYIQGYYFSKPLPFDKVKFFGVNFNNVHRTHFDSRVNM